jgi:hypothetical protein
MLVTNSLDSGVGEEVSSTPMMQITLGSRRDKIENLERERRKYDCRDLNDKRKKLVHLPFHQRAMALEML